MRSVGKCRKVSLDVEPKIYQVILKAFANIAHGQHYKHGRVKETGTFIKKLIAYNLNTL